LTKLHPTRSTTTTAPPKAAPPEVVVDKSASDIPIAVESTTNVLEELARLRELLEETLAGQTDHHTTAFRTGPGSVSSTTTSRPSGTSLPSRHHPQTKLSTTETPHDTQMQVFSQNINERVTDLQLAVNRLHQDVTAIRQVLERTSPLSTSLILGRTTGRK
jgi:hypothetical protein